jgi:hypothetical protein
MLTITLSRRSLFLAQISINTYKHIKETIVANITGFSSSLANPESLRLREFIGTAKPAPKAVKWSQRQWIRYGFDSGPT